MASCSHCGGSISDPSSPLCAVCEAAKADRARDSKSPEQDVEFDHRGIRLPARMRVGGIIIPQ
jgi:hypothetical protein